MPRRPQWLKDLAEITHRVEGLPTNVISRETFEFVFNLQRTAAAYWLRRLGAETHGNTLLIDKRTLLLALYNIASSPEYLQEVQRRDRLAEHLEKVRCELAARRVRVPYFGEPPRQIAGLPENLALSCGPQKRSSSLSGLLHQAIFMM
jgi:hypothetical protein